MSSSRRTVYKYLFFMAITTAGAWFPRFAFAGVTFTICAFAIRVCAATVFNHLIFLLSKLTFLTLKKLYNIIILIIIIFASTHFIVV